ncbi:MAG: hypothetical protein WAR57_06815, partial [Candidatus Phosphoribacter sp.]
MAASGEVLAAGAERAAGERRKRHSTPLVSDSGMPPAPAAAHVGPKARLTTQSAEPTRSTQQAEQAEKAQPAAALDSPAAARARARPHRPV